MQSASRHLVVPLMGFLLAACGSGSSKDEAPGTVDAARSTLVASPGSAVADGVAAVKLTATARDSRGAALPGRLATFTVSGSDYVLSAASATTDATGAASVTLTSTRAEAKTVSVVLDAVEVTQQATATFSAGAAASLSFVAAPTGAPAGALFSPAVRVAVLDAFGNPVTAGAYGVSLALQGGSAAAILSGGATAYTVGGAVDFVSLAVDKAGTGYQLVAEVPGLASATSAGFAVVAASPDATACLIAAAPSTTTAGGTVSVTVTVRDFYGNPVPDQWVILSSSRGATDTITPGYRATDASGAAVFSVTSPTAGATTITAFGQSEGGPFTLTTGLELVAGPVSGDSSTAVASTPAVSADGSSPAAVTVTLRDALGNPVSGKEVSLASSRGATDTISPGSGVSDASGAVAFTVVSSTFGPATFSATDTTDGLALSQTAQVTFTGTVSASRSTVVASAPSVLADGSTATTIAVTLLDAFGNPVAGKAVTLASSRGETDAVSPPSGATDAGGVVTFTARSSTFGTSDFAATVADLSLPLTQTARVSFRSFLVFATQPAASSTSGAALDPAPVVAARDAAGNTDAAFTSEVTLVLGANAAGGTLEGTLTVTAAGGEAAFSGLHLDKAGVGYTLVASTSAAGMNPATSTPFDVVPGAPARLAFAIQPSNTGAGIRPMIQVAIQDAAGNLTSVTGRAVTLSLGANPGGATLGGTLTSTSVRGVATFSGLTVSADGFGYTLVATATPDGLAPATSRPFDVTAPITVGLGTAGSCTEATLDAALASGGHVVFDCGPTPVTITLTRQHTVSVNTGLDGGGRVTLSGGGTTPLFAVNADTTLAIAGLVITGGRTGGNGGAIYNGGTLSVSGSTLSGNGASRANDYYGSPANGGAIFNVGTLLVDRSTFSGNAVSSDWCIYGTSANGGAIYNGGGTLLVSNSTFSGNSASSSYNIYGTGGNGGAIFNSGGAVWIVSSTLAGNGVGASGNYFGMGGQGGAIFGGATLTNTILARGSSGANCFGTFTDGGHDLDSDGTCGVGAATDPHLDAAGLADHGGPTLTIALDAASPAIAAGDPSTCAAAPVLGVDQRGYARPGAGATACSVGAFEFGSGGPP
jgi:hypothetical protein